MWEVETLTYSMLLVQVYKPFDLQTRQFCSCIKFAASPAVTEVWLNCNMRGLSSSCTGSRVGHPEAGSVRVCRPKCWDLQRGEQEETLHSHRHDRMPCCGAAGEVNTINSTGFGLELGSQLNKLDARCFCVCHHSSGWTYYRHGPSLQTLPLELHHECYSGQTSCGPHLT